MKNRCHIMAGHNETINLLQTRNGFSNFVSAMLNKGITVLRIWGNRTSNWSLLIGHSIQIFCLQSFWWSLLTKRTLVLGGGLEDLVLSQRKGRGNYQGLSYLCARYARAYLKSRAKKSNNKITCFKKVNKSKG